jgi:hypothetical protein
MSSRCSVFASELPSALSKHFFNSTSDLMPGRGPGPRSGSCKVSKSLSISCLIALFSIGLNLTVAILAGQGATPTVFDPPKFALNPHLRRFSETEPLHLYQTIVPNNYINIGPVHAVFNPSDINS